MRLSDLVAGLRSDLANPDAALLSDPTMERCVRKAIFRVGADLESLFIISDEQILPQPDEATVTLFSIYAQIEACRVMRAATANAFSFSSADKRVDKTGQPEQWAKLEADLTAQYVKALKAIRPDATVGEDTYLLTPRGLSAILCEQGGQLHDDD